MTTVEFLQHIKKLNVPFLQTGDIASSLGISKSLASKHLEVLNKNGLVTKILRGKWMVTSQDPDPMQAAEFITSPYESYVSLQTALFYHGMIQQVPTMIYAVTVARSKTVRSPIGTFSFHHCNPSYFFGYEYLKPLLNLATPEKALVDYIYFSPTKSRQFLKLPELELPKKFSWKKVLEFTAKIPSPRTKSLVLAKIGELRK